MQGEYPKKPSGKIPLQESFDKGLGSMPKAPPVLEQPNEALLKKRDEMVADRQKKQKEDSDKAYKFIKAVYDDYSSEYELPEDIDVYKFAETLKDEKTRDLVWKDLRSVYDGYPEYNQFDKDLAEKGGLARNQRKEEKLIADYKEKRNEASKGEDSPYGDYFAREQEKEENRPSPLSDEQKNLDIGILENIGNNFVGGMASVNQGIDWLLNGAGYLTKLGIDNVKNEIRKIIPEAIDINELSSDVKKIREEYNYDMAQLQRDRQGMGELFPTYKGDMNDAFKDAISFTKWVSGAAANTAPQMIGYAVPFAGQVAGPLLMGASTAMDIHMTGIENIAKQQGISPEQVIERGLDKPLVAIAAAIPIAALDKIGVERMGVRAAYNAALAQEVRVGVKKFGWDQFKRGVEKRTVAAADAGIAESVTEATQDGLTQLADSFSSTKFNNIRDFLNYGKIADLDIKRILNAAALGGFTGSLFNGAGSLTGDIVKRIDIAAKKYNATKIGQEPANNQPEPTGTDSVLPQEGDNRQQQATVPQESPEADSGNRPVQGQGLPEGQSQQEQVAPAEEAPIAPLEAQGDTQAPINNEVQPAPESPVEAISEPPTASPRPIIPVPFSPDFQPPKLKEGYIYSDREQAEGLSTDLGIQLSTSGDPKYQAVVDRTTGTPIVKTGSDRDAFFQAITRGANVKYKILNPISDRNFANLSPSEQLAAEKLQTRVYDSLSPSSQQVWTALNTADLSGDISDSVPSVPETILFSTPLAAYNQKQADLLRTVMYESMLATYVNDRVTYGIIDPDIEGFIDQGARKGGLRDLSRVLDKFQYMDYHNKTQNPLTSEYGQARTDMGKDRAKTADKDDLSLAASAFTNSSSPKDKSLRGLATAFNKYLVDSLGQPFTRLQGLFFTPDYSITKVMNDLNALLGFESNPYKYPEALRKGKAVRAPSKNVAFLSALISTSTGMVSNEMQGSGLTTFGGENGYGNLYLDPVTGERLNMQFLHEPIKNASRNKAESDLLLRKITNYAIARRTLVYQAKFGRDKGLTGIAPTGKTDVKQAQEIIAEFNKEPQATKDTINEAIRRYQEFGKYILYTYKESGIISQDLYDKLVNRDLFWIDLHRIMDDTSGILDGDRGNASENDVSTVAKNIDSILKETQGGNVEIGNIYGNLIRSVYGARKLATRNLLNQTIISLIDEVAKNVPGYDLTHIGYLRDEPSFSGKSSLSYDSVGASFDGKPRYLVFNDPNLARDMKDMNGVLFEASTIAKLTTPLAAWVRATITSYPKFILFNMQRDYTGRYLNSIHTKPSSLFTDIPKVVERMAEYISSTSIKGKQKDDAFNKNRRAGGIPNFFSNNADEITGKLFSTTSKFQEGSTKMVFPRWVAPALGAPGEAVKRMSNFSESISRGNEFQAAYEFAKEYGMNEDDARMYGAYHSMELLNFSRGGSLTRAINQLSPFFNVQFQGLRRTGLAIQHDPVNFFIKTGLMSLIGMVFKAQLLDRPDDSEEEKKLKAELRQEYFDKPTYKKRMFMGIKFYPGWNVSVPVFQGPESMVPFISSLAFDRYVLGDQRAFEGLPEELVKIMPGSEFVQQFPFSMFPGGTAVSTVVTGTDTFRDRDIIPDSEKKIEGQDPGKAYGSLIANKVAERANSLPIPKSIFGSFQDSRGVDAWGRAMLGAWYTTASKLANGLSSEQRHLANTPSSREIPGIEVADGIGSKPMTMLAKVGDKFGFNAQSPFKPFQELDRSINSLRMLSSLVSNTNEYKAEKVREIKLLTNAAANKILDAIYYDKEMRKLMEEASRIALQDLRTEFANAKATQIGLLSQEIEAKLEKKLSAINKDIEKVQSKLEK